MTATKKEVSGKNTTAEKTDVVTNRAEYDASIDSVNGFPDDKIIGIVLAPEKLMFWAEELYNVASVDMQFLGKAGLYAGKPEELQRITGTLRQSQADLMALVEKKTTLKTTLEEAATLTDKVKHDELFAFRDSEEMVEMVNKATKGRTQASLVQHCANLASIGKEYSEPLTAIGFDVSQLDRLEKLSALLADLLGKSRSGTDGDTEYKTARLIRDKAYTMQHLLINEIREYGRYVFREDKEHLRKYMNPFRHHTKKAEETSVEEPEGQQKLAS